MTKARDIASAIPAPSTIDATELGYLDGVTSAIQTQIDSKIGSASAINPTIVDAKGDIIAATAADTVAKLAVGANGTVLTAASGQATGLEWATLPSASPGSVSNFVADGQNTNSSSYINLTTTQSVTLTTGTKVLVIVGCMMQSSSNYVMRCMSYEISGATTSAASDEYSVNLYLSDSFGNIWRPQMSYVSYRTVTAGSNTFTAKFRSEGGYTSFSNRTITVIDLGS